MTDKMSELDNENAGATDDGEADDIEMIEDEIDTTMMVFVLDKNILRVGFPTRFPR